MKSMGCRGVKISLNQKCARPAAIVIWAEGKQTRSFCYISDSLEGFYRLMVSDYNLPLNIGSDYVSCGLPVIAPNVGNWGKMIETEDCGIALKDGSVENYITALETVKGKDVWQDKSDEGTQAIKAKYNWNRVLSSLKNG